MQEAGLNAVPIAALMAFLIGVIMLAGGQFILHNIFYANGMLTVIIEFVGGILFLAMLFRRRGTM